MCLLLLGAGLNAHAQQGESKMKCVAVGNNGVVWADAFLVHPGRNRHDATKGGRYGSSAKSVVKGGSGEVPSS